MRDGTFALGQMLGQSWLADYATRWQDYWSAGGLGWIGDSYVTIEVPGARGNCLDVAGSGKTNGTPVQIYTCNGGASQQWTLEGKEDDLHLRNVGSLKCLDVAGNAPANGTKIQISDCYKSAGQSWKGDVRAAAPLKSVATGKCLDLSAFTKSTDARLWDCKNGAASQKFLIKPSGHKGTDSLAVPGQGRVRQGEEGRRRRPGGGEEAAGRDQGPAGGAEEGGHRVGHRRAGRVRDRGRRRRAAGPWSAGRASRRHRSPRVSAGRADGDGEGR